MRQLRSSLITTCALISCAPLNGSNEDHNIPVVNAILVSGQPIQALTIRWAGTPGDPNPGTGPSASDVNLWVTSTAADSVPVVSIGTLGRYTIALAPRSGVTYQLRGTILGVSVTGTTTVPTLAIIAPNAGDTVMASSAHDPFHRGLLPFAIRLAASGAAGYGVAGANVVEAQQGYLVSSLNDTLTVVYQGPGSLPVHAVITAFDSTAAAFYGVVQVDTPNGLVFGGAIQTTLRGVLGLFGSSASAPLDLVIVP